MDEVKVIFLDVLTKDRQNRMTSFSDTLTGIFEDFFSWTKKNGLSKEDILYAEVFRCSNVSEPEHIATLRLVAPGEAEMVPAPANSILKPCRKQPSLNFRLYRMVSTIKSVFKRERMDSFRKDS